MVGKIEISSRREDQVVRASERLQIEPFQDVIDPLGRRVDHDDAMPPVGDEQASVSMDLQAVRFAIVLQDDLELTFRVHAEDSSITQIDAI